MDWIAMIPVTLSDDEKRALETVAQYGEYIAGAGYSTIAQDALYELEERGFVTLPRRNETGHSVYTVTDIGKRWLQTCRRTEE
jgi:DNA-binding PadR family transcriptional regulator